MFKIILLLGLLLSPLLYAQVPDEFPGQNMQQGQQWSEQMWLTKSSKEYQNIDEKPLELEDLYLQYSYLTTTEMAEDFALGFCHHEADFYFEIGSYAFSEESLTFAGRNQLLDSLFKDQHFLNTLNACLKKTNQNIEPIVLTLLSVNVAARALNWAGISFIAKQTLKFFVKNILKKTTTIIKKTVKNQANKNWYRNGKEFLLAADSLTSNSYIGSLGFSGLVSGEFYNEVFKSREVRESFLYSAKLKCIKNIEEMRQIKLENTKAIYKQQKAKLVAQQNSINAGEVSKKLALLEKEYNIMLGLIDSNIKYSSNRYCRY